MVQGYDNVTGTQDGLLKNAKLEFQWTKMLGTSAILNGHYFGRESAGANNTGLRKMTLSRMLLAQVSTKTKQITPTICLSVSLVLIHKSKTSWLFSMVARSHS